MTLIVHKDSNLRENIWKLSEKLHWEFIDNVVQLNLNEIYYTFYYHSFMNINTSSTAAQSLLANKIC